MYKISNHFLNENIKSSKTVDKKFRTHTFFKRFFAFSAIAVFFGVYSISSVQNSSASEVIPLDPNSTYFQQFGGSEYVDKEFKVDSFNVNLAPEPEPEPEKTFSEEETQTNNKKNDNGVAPAAGTPDPGSAKAIALGYVGPGEQYNCLVALWNKESGWNTFAENKSSGAYGIPQSLPGNKMASAGADWRTNPDTQIRWGLGYIAARYGTPCEAWGHSQRKGWY